MHFQRMTLLLVLGMQKGVIFVERNLVFVYCWDVWEIALFVLPLLMALPIRNADLSFYAPISKRDFSRQKIFRFAFDAEALVIADSLGYSISEVPVSWYNSPESRVRPVRDAARTFLDLVFIKINLWSGRYF